MIIRTSHYQLMFCVMMLSLVVGKQDSALSAEVRSASEVSIGKCIISPRIDGDLQDKCWQEAVSIGPFQNLHSSDVLPTEKTYAYLTYDANNLYLGIECFDSNPQNVLAEKTKRDSEIWLDDCVEVFLDTRCSPGSYYHFVINALGARYDEMGKDNRQWDGDWQASASKGRDRWTVEMAIPFRLLRIGSDIWGINLTREKQRNPREISTWAPLREEYGFHDPEKFGILKGLDIPFYTSLKIREPNIDRLIGSGKAKVSVENAGKKRALALRLGVTDPHGKTRSNSSSVDVEGCGKKTLATPFTVSETGEYRFVLDIIDVRSKRIIYTANRTETVPPLLELYLPVSSYYGDDKSIPLKFKVNASEGLRAGLEAQIEIRNARGKLISKKKIMTFGEENHVSYGVSTFPIGTYSVDVRLVKGNSTLARARKSFEKIEGYW